MLTVDQLLKRARALALRALHHRRRNACTAAEPAVLHTHIFRGQRRMHDCSAEQPIPASEKFRPSGLLTRYFDVTSAAGDRRWRCTMGGPTASCSWRRAPCRPATLPTTSPSRCAHFEVDPALLTFTSVMSCTGLDRPATPLTTSPLRCDFTGLHVSRMGNGGSFPQYAHVGT